MERVENFLTDIPEPEKLVNRFPVIDQIPAVNAHVHTPYSFSAFDSIAEIFAMAVAENIAAVGINDFYVADGFPEFCEEALKSHVFPMFNIEFIALMKAQQDAGIRINDLNNPGRCYFTGKGLDFPFAPEGQAVRKLQQMVEASQKQVKAMVDRCNQWFSEQHADLILDFEQIRARFAKRLVRERHIAKAIRMAVMDRSLPPGDARKLFTLLFGGNELQSDLSNIPILENEIRSKLLKAGGKAFVEEEPDAFPPLPDIMEIIRAAGGIPCYPVLLDDTQGRYTEFESDPDALAEELYRRDIACIELIPGRNDAGHLRKFVEFFDRLGFIILLGTEHNTPERIALTCDTRGKIALDPYLKRIAYAGTCVVAAHQCLRAKGRTGFISAAGKPDLQAKSSLIDLGNAVIRYIHELYPSIL